MKSPRFKLASSRGRVRFASPHRPVFWFYKNKNAGPRYWRRMALLVSYGGVVDFGCMDVGFMDLYFRVDSARFIARPKP
jgi:hypothetical protein